MFCLTKDLANEFKARLKSGEINPQKLMDMNSKERNEYFSGFMGKPNAKEVNALFESKMILKNQQQGMLTWAKQVAGLKPEAKRDLIAKVQRMTKVLQPEEMDKFLSDLAAKRLGIEVTAEEAGKIADLAARVDETRTEMEAGGDRFAYGEAMVDFYNYTNGLKGEAEELTFRQLAVRPVEAFVRTAGFSKSIKASLDNSSIFRQGWKVLWSDPGVWMKNAPQTFVNMAKTIKGEDIMKAVNADIFSRPLYKSMVKAKLALQNVEEAFPSSLPEKIPGLGRLYKASQDAYSAFLYKTRADVFEKYYEIAKKSGVDVEDRFELESIGKLINSLTGRAHLGNKGELIADTLNNVFFSARFMKSNFDTLTAHTTDRNISWWARKRAALNLLKVASGSAAILTIANALSPDSVEWDPRSSDFGKIRVGDTRFDVTGGMGSIAVLASRLAMGIIGLPAIKNSDTGVVKEINTGDWGAQQGTGLIADFFGNKVSPVTSTIFHLMNSETFDGEKPTLMSEAINLFAPLPIVNSIENYKNPEAAPLLLTMLADALGISANTYSRPKTDAEKFYDEMLEMDPTEANKKLEKLFGENEVLYDMVMEVDERHKLGITDKDDYIKGLGVSDLSRARYIWGELERLNSPEEKNAYIEELVEKRVIPVNDDGEHEVLDQLARINEVGDPDDLIEGAKDATTEAGLIKNITNYGKAFGMDPASAFQAMFTGEKLRDVRNGTVIFDRIIGAEESTAIKKERGYGSVLDEVKLDHIVPLQLGGDNSDENLAVIPNAKWEENTPVENHLGESLISGKIDEETAREAIIKFKNGELTAQQVLSQY